MKPVSRDNPLPNSIAAQREAGGSASRWVVLLSLLSCSFLVLTLDGRPPGSRPSVGADSFSVARALEHLEVIAERPRPTGSIQSRRVVEPYLLSYLDSLGLETEVQATTAVRQRPGRTQAVRVRNILGRRPGTSSTGAILLLAHYDSVRLAPGAGDDGAGVVAILEALRALQDTVLQNDLIVLFSDGEELGLMGARAFAEQHSWADDVRVVLNFEGRGSGGASLLFETSPQNGRLIAEFSRGASFPVGNSLSYEVYKRMPNDTDFSVFKERGFVGLNFAFIEGFSHYHSPQDAVERLDPGSVAHHGAYVLNLSRHFGSLDLGENLTGPDAVYFNLFGIFFQYSSGWTIPLTVLASVVSFVVLLIGFRQEQIRWSGASRALAMLGLTAVVVPAASWVLLRVIQLVRADYWGALFGMVYTGPLFLAAFLLLGVAAFSGLLVFPKRPSPLEWHSCAVVAWLILAWLSAYVLPGASFLALWPVLGAAITSGVLLFCRRGSRVHGIVRTGALALSSALPIGILLPAMILTLHAFSVVIIPVLILIWVGVLALLMPALARLDWYGGKAFPIATGLAGIVLLGWAVLSSSFGVDQPRWDSLFYAFDADSDEGYWLSLDRQPDEWTRAVLGDSPERAEFSRFIGFSRPLIYQRGPVWRSDIGLVEIVSERTEGDRTALELRYAPGKRARAVRIRFVSEKSLRFAGVEDESGLHRFGERKEIVEAVSEWTVTYNALQGLGFSLHLDASAGATIALEVVERFDGFPDDPSTRLPPRPPNIVASKFAQSIDGSSLVLRRFTF